jgi:NADH dehydrogenase [ubiquinone] 1 alpha subcomplex assembly factor 7
MTKYLKSKIISLGPLSVASFMNEALLNAEHGYYYKERSKDKDIFGSKGDFITNPEISQIYSELIGIWTMTQWKNLGKPEKFRLVELGPGKGTLMNDLIKTCSKYEEFKKSIQGIHLIDASPNLMKQQIKKICEIELNSVLDLNAQEIFKSSSRGFNVHWNGSIEDIPNDVPCIFIAHEFFDALPVYQFEFTTRGWSEILIDFDDSSDTEYHFKYVLAPAPSIALRTLQHLIDVPEEIGNRIEVYFKSK